MPTYVVHIQAVVEHVSPTAQSLLQIRDVAWAPRGEGGQDGTACLDDGARQSRIDVAVLNAFPELIQPLHAGQLVSFTVAKYRVNDWSEVSQDLSSGFRRRGDLAKPEIKLAQP